MTTIIDSFHIFLDEFVNGHLARPSDERLPPFRLVESTVKPCEVLGYCGEWATQYLLSHRCPVYLLNLICVEVVNRVREIRSSEDETESSKANGIDAKPLCELAFKTVENVATEWLSNPPAHWQEVCADHRHIVSHHAIKNTRRKMEDRHTMVPFMKMFTDLEEFRQTSLYAVYDGHGGPEASYYMSAQFLYNLIGQSKTKTDKIKSLEGAFTKTDTEFSEKAAQEKLRGGSTGVVILIDLENLYISWLGDSQAILVRKGRVLQIMDPHKPENANEKKRIEGLGGTVLWHGVWRVNGNLAVSRAIGDIDHKPYISSEAESRTHPLTNDDEYVIIACDGLWDTVSPQQATCLVYDHIKSGKPHDSVAEVLVRAAKNEGSSDNITVIVVFLKEHICQPGDDDHSSDSDEEFVDALEEIH